MKMYQIVESCPSVLCMNDYVCVSGKSEKEVVTANGFVFHNKECQIKCPEINIFGIIFSTEGMKPDPEKIQGITETPHHHLPVIKVILKMINIMQSYMTYLS